MRVGSRRGFFRRRLGVTLALQQDLFVVGKGADNVSRIPRGLLWRSHP